MKNGLMIVLLLITLLLSCIDKPNYKFLADSQYKNKNYKMAISMYTKQISTNDSDLAYSYKMRAMCYYYIGELDSAISDIDSSILYKKDNIENLSIKGLILKKQQRLHDALDVYSTILYVDSDNIEALNSFAILSGKIGDHALAFKCYNKILNIDSTNYIVLCNRATLYKDLGYTDLSIIDCERALIYNPNYSNAYFILAVNNVLQKRYLQALSHFDKANELAPNDTQILKARGMAHIKMKELNKACNDFELLSKLGSKEATLFLKKYCNKQ